MTTELTPTPPPLPASSGQPPQLHLGALVAGGIFLIIGVSWLLELTDVLDVRWSMLMPVALVVVGAVLVLGARQARTGGLVALGIVLLLLAIGSSVVTGMDVRLDGRLGDQREAPTELGQLDDTYSIGAGSLDLDLTGIDPSEYDGTERIRADVGMGELVVTVPDDVEVRVVADIGLGEVSLFGEQERGANVDRRLESAGYADAGARLDIDARVGMGSLRVERD